LLELEDMMPIEKMGLTLVIVVSAAAATLWIASLVAPSLQATGNGWPIFVPAMMIGYVAWRLIGERIGKTRDDRLE
jgi:hypothetical protein